MNIWWKQLVGTPFCKVPKKYVCDRCEQKLSYIIGGICMDCGRPLDDLPTRYIKKMTFAWTV